MILNCKHYKMCRKCRKCVLVQRWLRIFCPSITFLLPHFLNEETKMLLHNGASTMSQTLSFSSTWPLAASTILALDLCKKTDCNDDGQAWANAKCSFHGNLLGFTAAKINFTCAQKTSRLKLGFCPQQHWDAFVTMILQNWWYCCIPIIHYFRMHFFFVQIFQAQFVASNQAPSVLWSATPYLQCNCVQHSGLLWLECPCCTFFKVLWDQCLVPPEMEKGQEFSSLQWNRKGQFDFSQMSSR